MIKRLNNKLYIFLLVAGLILTPAGCGPASNTGSTQANSSQPSTSTVSASASTASASEHSQAALALKKLLDDDPALMSLMEKSIKKAREINSDPDTSPVSNIEDLYSFIDHNVKAMPWNLLTTAKYPTLYNHIDQSIDYIWFLLDQPLEELEGKGYYYPTLQYHEPITSWLRDYSNEWGSFLSTEESWNDEYYERVKNDPSMNMQQGWYGDTNKWKTFNEWFSRHLIDPSLRPIADSDVVAPADSAPQGLWNIDENGDLVQKEGVIIKSADVKSVAQLIGPDSQYTDKFKGGTLTHTFLDVNDYHRYHFPIDGTVKEIRKIPGKNAAGGITVWNPETKRYVLEDAVPGWQMIETRDCIILETRDFGYVAILPIGMSQICSCNWEESIKVGDQVKRGDPMGYFLFGGSDIVMVFQSGVKAQLVCPENETKDGYKHVLMGEAYMKLTK
ncbi:MAG: phosphatidylserine decarboxylase [Lachnospiraceae bacterium]|nr:phosphatidylserine decarboxylase [Lachnospiraceae bacterium]